MTGITEYGVTLQPKLAQMPNFILIQMWKDSGQVMLPANLVKFLNVIYLKVLKVLPFYSRGVIVFFDILT